MIICCRMFCCVAASFTSCHLFKRFKLNFMSWTQHVNNQLEVKDVSSAQTLPNTPHIINMLSWIKHCGHVLNCKCCCCDESRQKIQFYVQVHSQSRGYKCNWFDVTSAISWWIDYLIGSFDNPTFRSSFFREGFIDSGVTLWEPGLQHRPRGLNAVCGRPRVINTVGSSCTQ